MTVTQSVSDAGWIVLMFNLPAKQASQRVEVWRKLKRYGALPLASGGHLLPNTGPTLEHFEWLAVAIRKFKGQASVLRVHSVDDLPDDQLRRNFVDARSKDYEQLQSELKKVLKSPKRPVSALGRIRKRFSEIAVIDFFNSPVRSRLEAMLARSSAWLISHFIDKNARFVFDDDPARHPKAVPFDMFQGGGFGHRGDDCTFETLCKEFRIHDAKVQAIAQVVHDADLEDEKFGRNEGTGLDRVLVGWAKQNVGDDELLRRGMQLIEGLYNCHA